MREIRIFVKRVIDQVVCIFVVAFYRRSLALSVSEFLSFSGSHLCWKPAARNRATGHCGWWWRGSAITARNEQSLALIIKWGSSK